MTTNKRIESWQTEDAKRLDALFKERARLNQADFGDRYGIGTQGMVWQYLSGRRPLNIRAAEAFSRGLGIAIDDFSPTIAAQIRHAAERVDGSIMSWPFQLVDKKKVDALGDSQLAQLEAAVLIASAQVGLDIKKDD